MNTNTHIIAAYGTLRKGYSNHHLLKGSKFLGYGHTGTGYTKIIGALPFLIENPDGKGCDVEIYEVSALTFKLLDRLEGHPDLYYRKILNIKRKDSDEIINAWVYLFPEENLGRL